DLWRYDRCDPSPRLRIDGSGRVRHSLEAASYPGESDFGVFLHSAAVKTVHSMRRSATIRALIFFSDWQHEVASMSLCRAWLGCPEFRVAAWVGLAATILLGREAAAQTFHIPPDPAPATLASGQTLYLGPGGTLPAAFNALAGSTIHVV